MSSEISAYDEVVTILSVINTFKQIKRNTFVPEGGGRRFENDAEHSFEIALASWYIADTFSLQLDTRKIISYALVHDILEVYMGDFDPYMHSGDDSYTLKKEELEAKSLQFISKNFLEVLRYFQR